MLPASLKRGAHLVTFLFSIFFASCSSCNQDDNGVHSTRCDPAIPELSRNFDPTRVDWCTAENIDDNCDGIPDKDCQCDNGDVRECSDEPNAGIGVCVWGTQTCGEKISETEWSKEKNGLWSPCIGAGHPAQEICDGEDNDCDDAIDGEDEDLFFALYPSSTEC